MGRDPWLSIVAWCLLGSASGCAQRASPPPLDVASEAEPDDAATDDAHDAALPDLPLRVDAPPPPDVLARDVAADDGAPAWPCVPTSPTCRAILVTSAALARDRDDVVVAATIDARRVSWDTMRIEAWDADDVLVGTAAIAFNSSIATTRRVYFPGGRTAVRARLSVSGAAEVVGGRVEGVRDVRVTELPVAAAGAACDAARLLDTCPDGHWCGRVSASASRCLVEAAPPVEDLVVRTDPDRSALFALWSLTLPLDAYSYVVRVLDGPGAREQAVSYAPTGQFAAAGWRVPVGARVGVRAVLYLHASTLERLRRVEGPETVVVAGAPAAAADAARCDGIHGVLHCAPDVPCLPTGDPTGTAHCTPTTRACAASWEAGTLTADPEGVRATSPSTGVRAQGCDGRAVGARAWTFVAPSARAWRFEARFASATRARLQVRRWCSVNFVGATCGEPSAPAAADSVARVTLRAGEQVTALVLGDPLTGVVPPFELRASPE